MTTATFTTNGDRIESVTVKGHTGLAEEGQDVLCAAVTSAVRLLECSVNDILGVGAAVKVSRKTAAVSLKLPGDMGAANEKACQALMAGLMLYFATLSEENPDHFKVIDTEV